MSLILEGFMGSGKSAVGERLALRLDLLFIDTDREIEERQGCSVADIFSSSEKKPSGRWRPPCCMAFTFQGGMQSSHLAVACL